MRDKTSNNLEPVENQRLRKELNEVGELAPISVREARKIMGADAKSLSDDEVQNMIFSLTSIARTYIKNFPKY